MKKKLLIFLIIILLTQILSVNAQDSRVVYIAGTTDEYPLEYYNESTGKFEGIIPDLLKLIEDKSGITFKYINKPGEEDRYYYGDNLQVEVVSNVKVTDYFDTSSPLLAIDKTSHTQEIYLGFTSICSEELRNIINEGINSITENEKINIVYRYTQVKKDESSILLRIMIMLGISSVIVVVLTILILKTRKSIKADKYTDKLTSIGNNEYFKHNYETFINSHNRELYAIIYLRFNLDMILQLYGSAEADACFIYIARVLTEECKDYDFTAKISDYSFAMAYRFMSDSYFIAFLDRLVSRIKEYQSKYDKEYNIEPKIGAYKLEAQDYNVENALYNASQGYIYAVNHNQDYKICDTSIKKQTDESKQINRRILEAIQRDEMEVFLQPIVELENETVIGAEVLLKWNHPTLGQKGMGEFISLLEETGTIIELNFYAFRKVIELQSNRKKKDLKNVYMSVNMTLHGINHKNFRNRVEEILSKAEVDTSYIIIELNENIIMKRIEEVNSNIDWLRQLGFKVCFDAFGRGKTNIREIKNYNVDIIKLDKLLLNEISDPKGKATYRAVVGLFHEYGFVVSGLGAEAKVHVDFLKEVKCDYVQGFYYYRPMPVKQYEKLCASVVTC